LEKEKQVLSYVEKNRPRWTRHFSGIRGGFRQSGVEPPQSKQIIQGVRDEAAELQNAKFWATEGQCGALRQRTTPESGLEAVA
jgi:hypothetical protein